MIKIINKIVDECHKLKGIVKTDTFYIIDSKELVTVVVRTKQNRYLSYHDVDFLNFDYEDSTFYVYDINKGYNKPLKNERIERITIL